LTRRAAVRHRNGGDDADARFLAERHDDAFPQARGVQTVACLAIRATVIEKPQQWGVQTDAQNMSHHSVSLSFPQNLWINLWIMSRNGAGYRIVRSGDSF
jgi:hypothetical protein